jgi:hypothetical protein
MEGTRQLSGCYARRGLMSMPKADATARRCRRLHCLLGPVFAANLASKLKLWTLLEVSIVGPLR